MKNNNYFNKYEDGAEKFLIDFFSKNPESEMKEEIELLLKNNNSWAIKYHLSEQRRQLVNWIPINKDSSLLEVGAGCGALTGYYCEIAKKVVASELEDDRAEVIRRRFSDKNNLKIVQSNLLDLKNDKFDVLSIVGVLEYSGRFVVGDSPYKDFLSKTCSLLNKDGFMILAIENKLGLKYFTGCSEDHLGKYFESINGYPGQDGVETFSKNNLELLLKEAGYSSVDFYYPYPDYKLPQFIFSDEYLKNKKHFNPSQFFNSLDYSRIKLPLIDESIFGQEIAVNGILGYFANSFLVLAKL